MTLLTKADVKPYLNMVSTDNDDLLDDVIAAAEEWAVSEAGPVTSTAVTQRAYLVGRKLVLNTLPVASVTSVTGVESGTALPAGAYSVDTACGVIEIDAPLDDAYTVVYSAGHSPVPERLRQAIIQRTRYLWRPQRGSGTRQGAGDNMDALRMSESLIAEFRIPF